MPNGPHHEHDHGHDRSHDHADACCDPAAPAPPADGRYRHVFKVRGLDCVEEVSALRRAVGPVVGGDDRLAFDVLNGRMMVLEEAVGISAEDIRQAVGKTGMTATEWRPDDAADRRAEQRHHRIQLWLTALSGVSVAVGFGLHVWLAGGLGEAFRLLGVHAGQPAPWAEIAAYGLAIVFGARFVVVKAWYAARALRPDIHLLMVIAVAGAIGIGEWFEAATVTFLFALSLLLETWSVGRARRAIAALLELAPPVVRLKQVSGEERTVAAEDVGIGSRFVVRPGERIPLDGVVVAGASSVNQAPITGESMPVPREAGAAVFAGTINGEGALEIESTRAARDTTLARIIRLVEEAHGRRARAEQWVERFARIYTPAVILLALAVFLLPPLLMGASWDDWFYRALVLLVIACPCALVISTPVSIVSALAASARQGVLVKGGSYIEQPARIRAIALDKTGTLTQGEPRVAAIVPLNDHTETELLERAAALEARSAHPLARAILNAAEEQGVAVTPADDAHVLPGKGVAGRFRDAEFWLGSHRYLRERGQETDDVTALAETMERDGRTVVLIGNDNHVCGLIAVADAVRPEARAVVAALRDAGVERLIMLTGDNRATAEAIGREVGIDEVQAELLPEDKVAAVERLVETYGAVAMVGDGVNDAPAMARANLGIAMGAIGSDAAIETADIALMTDDLSKLPWLVGHSRRTLAVIRQNIGFSLGVKAAFVVLTFGGVATLWGAIAADVGTSLLVVANALRLLRVRL
jgi:Cd2+/Zn2+-exporting ATPase